MLNVTKIIATPINSNKFPDFDILCNNRPTMQFCGNAYCRSAYLSAINEDYDDDENIKILT